MKKIIQDFIGYSIYQDEDQAGIALKVIKNEDVIALIELKERRFIVKQLKDGIPNSDITNIISKLNNNRKRVIFECYKYDKTPGNELEPNLLHYETLLNGTIVVIHRIRKLDDYTYSQKVVFEQPINGGFKRAEATLPNKTFPIIQGFTEDEMFDLQDYLGEEALLMWDIAKSSLK